MRHRRAGIQTRSVDLTRLRLENKCAPSGGSSEVVTLERSALRVVHRSKQGQLKGVVPFPTTNETSRSRLDGGIPTKPVRRLGGGQERDDDVFAVLRV